MSIYVQICSHSQLETFMKMIFCLILQNCFNREKIVSITFKFEYVTIINVTIINNIQILHIHLDDIKIDNVLVLDE